MSFSLQSYRTALVTLVAIAGLVACLVFTVARLLHVESDLRTEDTHTNLWQITQTQFEATLLAESLARDASGEQGMDPEEKPDFRLAILISRLAVLIEGPQGHLLQRLGALSSLKQAYLHLTVVEGLIDRLEPQADQQLRAQVRDLAYQLRDAANQVMVLNRAQGAETRSKYLRVVFESLAFIIGIVISASFLLLRLFRGLQETRQAKQLLRQEREFSDLVINNISNQGIVIFDERLNCLLWNPGMEILLGLKPDATVGKHLGQLDALFQRSEVVQALSHAIQGTSSIVENEGSAADGQERCLEINCFPLTMAERQLGIAFVRDVTEQWLARREAERHNFDLEIKVLQRTAALKQAERRLIAAIETAPDGFAAFDWTGKLLFANEQIRAAEPVAFWCQEEMTLSTFLRCFAMCEGGNERLLGLGVPIDAIELDLLIRKGVWARLSVTSADGGTIFVRLVDISGYKQAASALQSALDRERETTNAYRSFVSMVSHQFRTPLAIVDSSAQRILRRGAAISQDELVTRVQKIRNATNRLTRLVESVLTAAKLDAGRIALNPTRCDLIDLVADICDRQRELSPHAEIRFTGADCPIHVHCDSILIEQVIINLLTNAVKYSGDHPVVEIRMWTEGSRAFCSVRDWGIGIPTDEVGRIFERFYRARTATGIAGTGIGLSFAQTIMHLHGGEIRVESHEAAGSLFTFDLPVSSADEAQQAA